MKKYHLLALLLTVSLSAFCQDTLVTKDTVLFYKNNGHLVVEYILPHTPVIDLKIKGSNDSFLKGYSKFLFRKDTVLTNHVSDLILLSEYRTGRGKEVTDSLTLLNKYREDRKREIENRKKEVADSLLLKTDKAHKDTIITVKLRTGVGLEKSVSFSLSASDFNAIRSLTAYKGKKRDEIAKSIAFQISMSCFDLIIKLKNYASLDYVSAPGEIWFCENGFNFKYYINAQNGYGNSIVGTVRGTKIDNESLKVDVY